MIPMVEAQTVEHAEIVVNGIFNFKELLNIRKFAIVSEPQNAMEIFEHIKSKIDPEIELIYCCEVPRVGIWGKVFDEVAKSITQILTTFDLKQWGLDAEKFFDELIYPASLPDLQKLSGYMFEVLQKFPNANDSIIYPGVWSTPFDGVINKQQRWFMQLMRMAITGEIINTCSGYSKPACTRQIEDDKKNINWLTRYDIGSIYLIHGPLGNTQDWWNWHNIQGFRINCNLSGFIFYPGLNKWEESAGYLT